MYLGIYAKLYIEKLGLLTRECTVKPARSVQSGARGGLLEAFSGVNLRAYSKVYLGASLELYCRVYF